MNLSIESLASTAIVSVILFFFLYYYTANKKIAGTWLIRPLLPSIRSESVDFLSYKLSGIIFTGAIPFILFLWILKLSPSRVGFVAGRTAGYWYILLILILMTLIVSFYSSKSAKIRARSPELRLKDWYPRHVILSAGVWVMYLLGYEFLFRGVLWFLCVEAFGFWPALAINIILYSLVHLPQGVRMAVGTIPVGIIFCLLSSLTGSFLPAFIIHSFIAVSTEIFSLYHEPEVRLH
ncbi:MAG: CPBP family intramembrane metalloprotease [Bacteroidales bacterium]|nr:CPBP family intramembrane metalloprotease [Bacteroidales bacterium]